MSWLRTIFAALVGIAFVAVGISIGLESQPTEADGRTAGMILIALVALGVGLWKIRGTPDGTASAPAVPWTDEAFATPTPERADREPPLSSDGLARVVDRAGETARLSETVDEGMAVVRPVLRETLCEALVQGGDSREAALSAIDDGTWTDDPVAASVLSSDVEMPPQPFRDRLRAWLFPERAVRHRTRRAMDCVAAAADDALAAVPGQRAPRSVPVVQPRLEELQRGADGELQRAVNPDAIARGPRPRGPRDSQPRQDGDASASAADPADESIDREVSDG